MKKISNWVSDTVYLTSWIGETNKKEIVLNKILYWYTSLDIQVFYEHSKHFWLSAVYGQWQELTKKNWNWFDVIARKKEKLYRLPCLNTWCECWLGLVFYHWVCPSPVQVIFTNRIYQQPVVYVNILLSWWEESLPCKRTKPSDGRKFGGEMVKLVEFFSSLYFHICFFLFISCLIVI